MGAFRLHAKKHTANIDNCTIICIFGTNKKNMGQNAPHYQLEKLPPLREKVETMEILRQTNKSTAALAELKGIAKTIPNQGMLINAIVLQEAKDSSEIENIITTQDELYKALTVNKTHVSPETKEVVNYRKAIFHGYDLAKKQGFLRVNDIVGIQQKLADNTAGIRSTPGTVLKNDKSGEVVYTPPQDKAEILDLMTNFINHFNMQDDLSPLINLAILHYQFESIHPFYDGNGRTGRILNILYLILKDLLNSPILYLSKFIIRNQTAYYKLFQEVRNNQNWESWILFILQGIEKTANETLILVKEINDLMETTAEKIKEKLPKIYSKELVDLIFFEFYTKISYIKDGLGVSRKTASNYLSTLEKEGFLLSEKIGRERIYLNKALFRIVKEAGIRD